MNEAYYLAGGVILGAGIVYTLMKNRQNDFSKVSEQLVNIAKDKLGAEKEVIKTDLEGKKDAIKTLVDEIRIQLKDAGESLNRSEKDRISSFSALQEELKAHKQLAHELRGSTDELKNVLSNNQTRGQFGERIAEDLLKTAGFVINQDYFVQHQAGEGRPDFTLVLPDKTKVNIDVKFPYQNLQKSAEAKDNEEKKRHFVQFQRDVRKKISDIANRNYINPDDNTVDFAVAFIPNEMIFSYIYERSNDIWEEAMSKKVILAGPYSFVALLRLIKQAHSNFQMQSNIHGVIQLVQKFRQEYDKFSSELDKVGNQLDTVRKTYDSVTTTRSRQLGRVIDQIDNQQIADRAKEPLLDNQQPPNAPKDERLLEK